MISLRLLIILLGALSTLAFVVPPQNDVTIKNVGASSNTATYFGSNPCHDESSMSPERKQRIAREAAIQKKFASGAELKDLRTDIDHLQQNKKWAQLMNDGARVNDLAQAIKERESRDPDLMYSKALNTLAELQKTSLADNPNKEALKESWTKIATEARSCISRFQLQGLWIGSYGEQGFEMINVTYTDDTLIATKVTGDKTVPRGAISFKADLSPLNQASARLPPISLSSESASKWGVGKLSRFVGEGQIAKKGYTDSKFLDGQFIMFDSHFSFVWIPTRHHVFFGRPSPEVALSMLRDTISKEDEVENMRNHLERCMDVDVTTSIARSLTQSHDTNFRRIARAKELKKLKEKTIDEEPTTVGFGDVFNVHKWRNYFDSVFNSNDKKSGRSK